MRTLPVLAALALSTVAHAGAPDSVTAALERARAGWTYEDAAAWHEVLRERARVEQRAVAVARAEVGTARAQVRAAERSRDDVALVRAHARLRAAEDRVDAARADVTEGRRELALSKAGVALARAEVVVADRALDHVALVDRERRAAGALVALRRAERRAEVVRERLAEGA